MREMSLDDFKSNLGEGFHTAFRKATELPKSHEIWVLIRELPPKEWGAIIDFVADGIVGWDPKDKDILIRCGGSGSKAAAAATG